MNRYYDIVQHDEVIRTLVHSFVFAIAMFLGGQIWIPLPFTPVPATLQTFALFAGALMLSPVESGLGMVLYMLLGVMGVGVFVHSSTLIDVIAGPTYGYIVGFLLAAPAISLLKQRMGRFISGLMGLLIVYISGLLWLATFVGLKTAFMLGILPFIWFDLIKLFVASLITK